jgi:gliding motility-associated-like protein
MRLYVYQVKFFSILLLSLFFSMGLNGQNGQYEVRFLTQRTSCASREVYISLQVRASKQIRSFYMGDANYRFEYDPRQLANPRIGSQEHFSNIPPSNDLNYGPQNLNGSSAGTTRALVSLNTFYSGAANTARQVDSNWTTVSIIGFDILNGATCFDLVWHDDRTFPITGMNEVITTAASPFAYRLENVAANAYFGNITACFLDLCPPIEPNKAPLLAYNPVKVPEDSIITFCSTIEDSNRLDKHNVSLCSLPQNGSITSLTLDTLTRSVCMTYKPKPNFNGPDTVCVKVCDIRNDSICSFSRIPITVLPRLDTPSVKIDPITTPKDSSFTKCYTIVNPDFPSLSYSSCASPVNGRIEQPTILNNQLCFTYRPNAGFVGQDSFCVQICTQTGLCITQRVYVNVLPSGGCVDTAVPVLSCPARVEVSALGQIISNDRNIISGASLKNNCSDLKIDFTMPTATDDCTQYPSVSRILANASDTLFTVGTKTVVFEAKDKSGKTSRCSIQVVVNNNIERPKIVNDKFTVAVNTNFTGNVLTNDTINFGLPVNVRILSNVNSGTLTFNRDGSFEFKPAVNFVGTASFVYEVCYMNCPNTCQQGIVLLNVQSATRIGYAGTNVITPNGDGVNDALEIDNLDLVNNQSSIVIYNQWGNVVYRAAPYKNDWSGTFSDTPLPDGTYYFIFKPTPEAEAVKDFVTILR